MPKWIDGVLVYKPFLTNRLLGHTEVDAAQFFNVHHRDYPPGIEMRGREAHAVRAPRRRLVETGIKLDSYWLRLFANNGAWANVSVFHMVTQPPSDFLLSGAHGRTRRGSRSASATPAPAQQACCEW